MSVILGTQGDRKQGFRPAMAKCLKSFGGDYLLSMLKSLGSVTNITILIYSILTRIKRMKGT
jgi:hypothetical protein